MDTKRIKAEKRKFEDLLVELTSTDTTKLYNYIHTKLDFKRNTFPGTHNVTFLKKHFNNLLEKDYLSAEKSDGKRILLFVFKIKENAKVFCIDRTNKIYKISNFKIKSETALLDCEVVDLKNGDFRVLVFDCMIFENKSIVHKNLYKRLHCAELFLKNIADQEKKLQKVLTPFNLSLKEMFKAYGFYSLYQDRENLEHENDGIVFTPVNEEYKIGVNYSWFKWKPADLNTVDFVLKRFEGIYEMYICMKDDTKLVLFDYYFPDSFYADGLGNEEDLHDKIAEFQWMAEKEVIDPRDFTFKKGG